MDSWLKWLIAAACLVIIAGGGYFAWSEWQAHNQALVQADYDQCLKYVDYEKQYRAGSDGTGIPLTERSVKASLDGCRKRFTLPQS
jgi:hypothetical protein